MRVGDEVRDRAELAGIVEKIEPGCPCRVLVRWSGGFRTWVDAAHLHPASAAAKTIE